jgi:ferric-dicitrate binding protein FerR (iron transport regulator)
MELVLRKGTMGSRAGRIAVILFVLIICLLWFPPEGAAARRPMTVKIGQGEARVTALEGTAQVASERGRWRSLKTGGILKGGDQVQTGSRSRLEITLPDSSFLRFADHTNFKILQIDMSESAGTRNARVNMALGKTWANVSKTFGVKPNIEVACENAVTGVRGTVYRMNVNEDKSALVRVYEGEVRVWGGMKPMEQSAVSGPPTSVSGPVSIPGPRSVSMEEWVEIIRAMQQITISASGVPGKPRGFTEAEDRDDWVDWNKARDESSGIPEASREEAPEAKGGGGFFNWFR